MYKPQKHVTMAKNFDTKNGYSYFEAMSALQKSIRRCMEAEALFWAIELYDSGFVGHLWNRLLIIAAEDIGMAEPYFYTKLMAAKEAHDYLAEKRPQKVSKKLVFIQAILMCVYAKKSRYVDLVYSVHWAKHDEHARNKKVPDFAHDMHTYKGKKMGRGLDHFYAESAKVNNHKPFSREEEYVEMAKAIDKEEQNKKHVQRHGNQDFDGMQANLDL